jgi:hypothetical protein
MKPKEYKELRERLDEFKIGLGSLPKEKLTPLLDRILSLVEMIKDENIQKLKAESKIDTENTLLDLRDFFDPIFDHNGQKIFELYNKESPNHFFLRKSFQLSHAHGTYSDILKKEEEIRDYFHLNLVGDYYETLRQRLRELCRAFYSPKKQWVTGAENFYKNFYVQFPNSILPELDISPKWPLRKLRNKINHAEVVSLQSSIEIHKGSIIPKPEYFPKIRGLINYFIAFSTEFDLRILNLFQRSNFESFRKEWSSYFDIYYKSWETRSDLHKSE